MVLEVFIVFVLKLSVLVVEFRRGVVFLFFKFIGVVEFFSLRGGVVLLDVE